MEDLFKTYFLEVIDKRIKYIDMCEKDEDKGTGMWEDLIKFFVMAGYHDAIGKGDMIDICLETKPTQWIHLYRRDDRVMIKAESINKLFGYDEIKGVNEIYFVRGGVSTQKGWYFELEFEYQGKPFILRFMNEKFSLNRDFVLYHDKLTVAVKFMKGIYEIMTRPITVNTVFKRPDYDALKQ